MYTTVCVAQHGHCGETCTTSYRKVCRNFASNNVCEAFCSGRFGRICDAKCLLDEEDILICECELPADLCPQK